MISQIFTGDNASIFYPKEDLTSLSSGRITELVLDSLKSLLDHSLRQTQDALIINPGFMRHLPYDTYTHLINQISQLIKTFNNTAGLQIVWSTLIPLPAVCCSLVSFDVVDYHCYFH